MGKSENTPGIGRIIRRGDHCERDAIHMAVYPAICGDSLLSPGDGVRINSDGTAANENTPDGKTHGIVDPFLLESVKKGQKFWVFLYPGSITSIRHVWAHPEIPDPRPMTDDRGEGREGGEEGGGTFGEGYSATEKERLEREAFANALTVNPYDATTRNQFIDWLEERGLTGEAEEQRNFDADKQRSEDWLTDFASDFGMTLTELMLAAQEYLTNGEWHHLSFDTPDRAFQEMNSGGNSPFWDHYQKYTGKEVPDERKVNFFHCSC